MIISSTINAQKEKENLARWYDWTDSAAFAEGPDPILKEFGPLSDSLSKVYDGKMILIANNQYYIINSLGDYYLWFIDRFPALFKGSVSNYHHYYEIGNEWGMCQFVIWKYKGKHFPVRFRKWSMKESIFD
jgi:hypothetical protein